MRDHDRHPAASERLAPASAERLAEELRRLQEADAADDEAAADQALGGLFAVLERPAPAADFAARVMARIEASPLRSLGSLPRARDLPRALRLPVAAALALAGVSAFYLLPLLLIVAPRLQPESLLRAAGAAFNSFGERLAGLAFVFQLGRQLFDALLVLLASPPGLLGFAGTILLAGVLSRWLWLLLDPARRSSDVLWN